MASASDIVVVLTGGAGNTNPFDSIGGAPSNQPIIGILNNLFDNITDVQLGEGHVDYRCIYIFNDNSTDTLYNVKFYVSAETSGGANVKLGLLNVYEIQRITAVGSITGGNFEITYTPPGGSLQTRTVDYNPDPATWAENLETAINSIDTLDCNVGVSGTFGNRIFNITFTDFRSHDLIGTNSTDLVGTGTISTGTSKVTIGSPVNAIPAELDVETTPPSGVDFDYPTAVSPVIVGSLYPEEGFSLWIKREIDADSSARENDGFKLRISFNPLP